MCWRVLVGSVEIEERRPRTWGKPPRERGSDKKYTAGLNFEKSSDSFFGLLRGQQYNNSFIPYSLFDFNPPSVSGTQLLPPNCREAKFLAFLSLYGSNGVPLRDLITFATLRSSCKPSENHWLLSGEVGPILRPVNDPILPTHCSFLDAFVRETSDYQGIDSLQKRLLSLGLIRVKYPMGHSSPTKHDWRTDDRVWCVAENRMSSHLMVPRWDDLDGEDIIMDLLYVFLEMPSKDVSLLAERHRETYYNHAHLFALEALRFNQTILRNARDYTVALILQLLTHRSQDGDEKLLQFAKAWPSSANGYDWAIMVLLAEVKQVISSGNLKIDSALNDRIIRLLSSKGKRQRRANGLIGYLLVELEKAAKESQDKKLTNQLVAFAMEWVETAWSSGSSIECAALCCVLANFRMLDKWVLVPPEHRLLFGYHLSRAGHLKQAKEFLTSGLWYHSSFQLFSQLWGYQFELVSVLIRLGYRQEAEVWLRDIEEHMMSPNGDEKLNPWERLRQYVETRLLLGLYQADLLMAAGEVGLVASRLENTISAVCLMDKSREREERGDGYFRSLHLTLETRLLEVQTWDGSPERALKVAKGLAIECRETPPLRPDVVQWITQQLLALSNRLVWAGHVSAASSLLESIVNSCRYRHNSDSLRDLLPYAEQRKTTVGHLLTINHADNDPITLGPESKAATKAPPERFEGPSHRNLYVFRHATADSADLIERAPISDAKTAAIGTSRNDHSSSKNIRYSGTKIDLKSNIANLFDGCGSTEGPNASGPAMSRPREKVSLTKPAAPSKTSRRGSANNNTERRGLRRSVAAILRGAPRVPTTRPTISVVDSREGARAPSPTPQPTPA